MDEETSRPGAVRLIGLLLVGPLRYTGVGDGGGEYDGSGSRRVVLRLGAFGGTREVLAPRACLGVNGASSNGGSVVPEGDEEYASMKRRTLAGVLGGVVQPQAEEPSDGVGDGSSDWIDRL